jgi:hypothetical protein
MRFVPLYVFPVLAAVLYVEEIFDPDVRGAGFAAESYLIFIEISISW